MQSGEIRLAVYGMKYFQVFDLPPVSQEQCSIRISGDLFQIPEDITLHLEALDGEWCFPESREYSVHWKNEASVYKGYKRDKREMRGDRAEMSDFPLYLNTVAGGLDCRNQAIGGFSFVVKIYALPVVEIIGQFLYLLGRYGFDTQIGYCF